MPEAPLVGIIMGSQSDWDTMRHADEMLTRFGVPHECRVVSAHRTPVDMAEYASGAAGRGLEVIIAGAGGAARRPGYRVHTLAPEHDTPTGQIADLEITAAYDDVNAVGAFAQGVDVVTFEFENVSAAAAAAAEAHAIVRPSGRALWIAQHRLREKSFLREHGLPVTPFAAVNSVTELHQALDALGRPSVLKTASVGYDGK